MRRFAALAGTLAATAIAGVAPPAAAKARGLAMPLRVSGTVVATWHGDPARGCAAAGVCGTTGSATYRPGFDGRLEVSRNSVGFGGSESAEPPVVRVRSGSPSAPTGCADVLEGVFSPLAFDYLGDELQVTFQNLELSAGRCTGPRTLDVAHALPRGAIKTDRLRRAPRVLDLSARTRFVAGSFSGQVISTVKVALGRARTVHREFSPDVLRITPGRRSRTRFWVLDLEYRIRGASGTIVTDFRGLPAPACRALGACDTSGSSTYTVKGVSGRIDVLAGRRLRPGRKRPSVRAALAAVRRGSLPVYADSRLWHARATVAEAVTSPDLTCSDSLFAEPPIIDSRMSEEGLVLLLRSQDLGSFGDTLRTRCPGPSQSDVLGRGSLAHGSIAFAALGQPALGVTAGSSRTFATNGYRGTRRGQLELQLELVGSRVDVVRG